VYISVEQNHDLQERTPIYRIKMDLKEMG